MDVKQPPQLSVRPETKSTMKSIDPHRVVQGPRSVKFFPATLPDNYPKKLQENYLSKRLILITIKYHILVTRHSSMSPSKIPPHA